MSEESNKAPYLPSAVVLGFCLEINKQLTKKDMDCHHSDVEFTLPEPLLEFLKAMNVDISAFMCVLISQQGESILSIFGPHLSVAEPIMEKIYPDSFSKWKSCKWVKVKMKSHKAHANVSNDMLRIITIGSIPFDDILSLTKSSKIGFSDLANKENNNFYSIGSFVYSTDPKVDEEISTPFRVTSFMSDEDMSKISLKIVKKEDLNNYRSEVSEKLHERIHNELMAIRKITQKK